MKKSFYKLSRILLVLFITSFFGCGNLMTSLDEKKASSKSARIRISLQDYSRTALPDININNLENFKFYYKTTNSGNFELLESWSQYDQIEGTILDINPGTYDFKITADCQGINYQDIKSAVTVTS